MYLIDTHTHLFSERFDEDRTTVVREAIAAGVHKMLLPNIDLSTIAPMQQLAAAFPEHCLPMMGLHPCAVTERWEEQLAVVEAALDESSYCAVGEIGIDLYGGTSPLAVQREAFKRQLQWAQQRQLPVAIHMRNAFEAVMETVADSNEGGLSGVFHCFTGTREQAEHILRCGDFKLGIGGIITFKNAGLADVIATVDADHLVLETDAPYLAPTPHRGKRNTSAYLPLIAAKLAEVKGMTVAAIAEVTTRNATDLFGC